MIENACEKIADEYQCYEKGEGCCEWLGSTSGCKYKSGYQQVWDVDPTYYKQGTFDLEMWFPARSRITVSVYFVSDLDWDVLTVNKASEMSCNERVGQSSKNLRMWESNTCEF